MCFDATRPRPKISSRPSAPRPEARAHCRRICSDACFFTVRSGAQSTTGRERTPQQPQHVFGRLLDQVGRLQRQVLNPRGLSFAVLTDREIKVMKLLADGLDTAEVGRRLFYSERTVKNIVHDVTSRLNLRNRTQAVAYALRQGLI